MNSRLFPGSLFDPYITVTSQSQLAQATSAHTTLVEIEKYNGTVEQVTAFNGPVEMVAQCEYVPASQVKS